MARCAPVDIAGHRLLRPAPSLRLLLVIGLVTVQPSVLCGQSRFPEPADRDLLRAAAFTGFDLHASIFVGRGPRAVEAQIPSPARLNPSQRRGLSIGSGIGVLVGGLIGWSLAPEAPANCTLECGTKYVAAALYTAGGAATGLVVGGGIGLIVGTVVDIDREGRPRTSVTFTIPLGPFD